MKTLRLLPAAMLALALLPLPTQAHEAGDWLFRAGAHIVDPKSDNGRLAGDTLAVDVDSSIRPTLMIEHMITANLGVELILATPFKHDISLNGVHAGSTRHLPPTLSLQYHFNPQGKVQPFIGAGLNYTWFDGEKSTGPIAGANLKLGNSWGLAAHAGIDVIINQNWFWGVDVRWFDIDSDVQVNGAGVGTANIDPLAYGLFVGYRF